MPGLEAARWVDMDDLRLSAEFGPLLEGCSACPSGNDVFAKNGRLGVELSRS